jgi:CRISPR-associated protein Cmr2
VGLAALYTVFTFAPVQGFIEKSRKLRDLYGASLILSYLTFRLIEKAEAAEGVQVISPGLPNIQEGMPNRIVLCGVVSIDEYRRTFFEHWRRMLQEVREWIEHKLPNFEYSWRDEWQHWGNHAWEFFWGQGASVREAMEDLEARKLGRDWTAINWTGESSSLSGTDAIAWPGLGRVADVRTRKLNQEKEHIQQFYSALAGLLDPEGKFLAENEQLSIPELVKRLVTWPQLARSLGMTELQGFTELAREQQQGVWTGWLMGDGDKIGDRLKSLAQSGDPTALQNFSEAMRRWGQDFTQLFQRSDLGRVIYAGGDDFLTVFYRPNATLPAEEIVNWLCEFPEVWRTHGRGVTVSAGFVWASPNVPQRDILQHCREAEKRAKSLGRNRLTIRVVFGNGQYVEWTCPWSELEVLQECRNWVALYKDLAQLKARYAFVTSGDRVRADVLLALYGIYFSEKRQRQLETEAQDPTKPFNLRDEAAINAWIENLINVGWQLCSST